MKKFDPNVPLTLKNAQQWFGSIIGRPIDIDSQMMPISPSGQPMEEEACDYIAPSPTLRPAERIQLYNQQYWWRLLSTLQETFPLATRLFGYDDFNQRLAIPYLVKYPPNHWSLAFLGERFVSWVEEEYHEDDRSLVHDAIHVDWAFCHSFCVRQLEPILSTTLPKEGDPSSLLDRTIYLQEHIHLFDLKYDLFAFRVEFLEQPPEYWLDNEFPPLKKEKDKRFYFVLFRDVRNNIAWKEIPETAFRLLQLFRQGTTIEKACEWLEEQDTRLYDEAMQHLHLWFQEWIVYRWLTLEHPL
jgi:hypothetical protein